MRREHPIAAERGSKWQMGEMGEMGRWSEKEYALFLSRRILDASNVRIAGIETA